MKEITEDLSRQAIRILLAEDNPVNMLLLRSIINNLLPQATVLEAENGYKAIELADKLQVDLIFMDVRMPEKNGLEATMEIRKQKKTKRPVIIAVTAGTSSKDKERCQQAGMDDYVGKPVVLKSISDILQKWLPATNENQEHHKPLSASINLQHFNIDSLRERLGLADEFLHKILRQSITSLDDCFLKLKKHQEEGNAPEAKEMAHKMKGLAINCSFGPLASLAEQAEYLIDQTEMCAMIEAIEKEIEKVKNVVLRLVS